MYTFTMACSESNVLILNDHVSLPIIISDWDAIKANKRAASGATIDLLPRKNSGSTVHITSSTSSRPHWTTGFEQVVDDFWNRMTDGLKQKLREACVEVLRRTENTSDDGILSTFDDDARLLD